MEPITLIVGALSAGAAAAAQDTASQAIKDAYAGLKALIQRRFAEKKKPEGEMALKKYEEKPAVWEAPLKDAIKETETDKADEILKAAEALKRALEKTADGREAVSKYILNFKNSEVGIIGDHAKVGQISFGKKQVD
jgi:hypothetical protein